ncbi:hypothetical protein HY636_02535 [Candidatus Woesearchaeota archaeon]|nr:hypothetical protein [Candidatus Woesearchaeota archaeon]
MQRTLTTIVLAGFLGLSACSEDEQEPEAVDVVDFSAAVSSASIPLCDKDYIVETCEDYCASQYIDGLVSASEPEQKTPKPQLKKTISTKAEPEPTALESRIISPLLNNHNPLKSESSEPSQSAGSLDSQAEGAGTTNSKTTETVRLLYQEAQKNMEDGFSSSAMLFVSRARNVAKLDHVDVTQYETIIVQTAYKLAQKEVDEGDISSAKIKIAIARDIAIGSKIGVTQYETPIVQSIYKLAQKEVDEDNLYSADITIKYARNIAKGSGIDVTQYETPIIQTMYKHAQKDLKDSNLQLYIAVLNFARSLAVYKSIPVKEHEEELLKTAIEEAKENYRTGHTHVSSIFINLAERLANENGLTSYSSDISSLKAIIK